jgi:hypothetical protein
LVEHDSACVYVLLFLFNIIRIQNINFLEGLLLFILEKSIIERSNTSPPTYYLLLTNLKCIAEVVNFNPNRPILHLRNRGNIQYISYHPKLYLEIHHSLPREWWQPSDRVSCIIFILLRSRMQRWFVDLSYKYNREHHNFGVIP